MCKSSIEYAELAGINISASNLSAKKDLTKDEETVLTWLTKRAEYLKKL